MCDCYTAKCEDCSNELPVHIGDFSTYRDNVIVRCEDHPPTRNDLRWVKFLDVIDDDGIPGDWYMACRKMDDVSKGYDVGEDGDIVPNCDWDGEEEWNP